MTLTVRNPNKYQIMTASLPHELATELLDILPNPVLVKNQNLEYVWINRAFENLFSVTRAQVAGKSDKDLFPNRQVSQCNGGDLRVLETGTIDEAVETVFEQSGKNRETITRKSRLTISDSEVYLIGVMHDITEVTRTNAALETSQKKLEEQAIELSTLATTDALTGCANRRQLSSCEQTLLQIPEQSTAVLAIDLDLFKAINDKYGHNIGDNAIKHFCGVTRSLLEADNQFVRLGGEEFAIIVADRNYAEVEKKANNLRELVENTPLLANGKSVNFTVSIGVSFKEEGQTTTIDDMLRIADNNLYEAKETGRNRVVMTNLPGSVQNQLATGS